MKAKKNVAIPDRVKSDKKATKAVEMKLASNNRSVKREIFDQAVKEKERLKCEEMALKEQERIR